MQRMSVGFGIDRDSLNAHLAAGADDTECDLAAIGNEDLFEHRA
jgi:hypothetical protein